MGFVFLVGFVAGGVVVGLLANRKPQWFASVVSTINAADNQAKKL